MRRNRETVLVRRNVQVELVPAGTPVELEEGTWCEVTQALGSSFTLLVEGQLVRLRGSDADAIGKKDPTPVVEHGDVAADDVEPLVWEALRTCYDPEIPINIVDLGLIYACTAEALPDGRFRLAVSMTLTAPGCGMGTLIADEARDKLLTIPGVSEAEVTLVWDPPWSREMMSEAARLEMGLY